MDKAEFEKYNEKMSKITDVAKLQKAIIENEDDIRKKAKMPALASLGGGWGSLALLLLTGFLTGWTFGVFWIVAAIAGAGILASGVAGLAGYMKYRKYFRAIRTQKRLQQMLDEPENKNEKKRARLERSLNKDLDYCRRKCLISDAERNYRMNSFGRPVVRDSAEASALAEEEVRAEVLAHQQTMSTFADAVASQIAEESFVAKYAPLKDNIDDRRPMNATILVKGCDFDEQGFIKCDETSGEREYIEAQFLAESDKDCAKYLRGISQNIKNKLADNSLRLPISIQILDDEGNPKVITVDGANLTELEFGDKNRVLLEAEDNFLDKLAESIEADLVPEVEEEHTPTPEEVAEEEAEEAASLGA